MKQLRSFYQKITVILASIFMLLVIISCEEKQKETNSITRVDIENMKENHIIPLKEAVKMYDKYTKDRVKILKDTLKKKYGDEFNDTRTVWLDMKTIKAYLKYLEENAGEAEGLQFYFSVDPDNKGKQSNHQTFFIAPTIKNVVDGDTIQSGFTVENGKRIFLYEAFKKDMEMNHQNMQKASFFSLMQDDDEGLLLNRGELGPPYGNN
ncbi:MAG: hypothetical protein R2821_10195 [Flavobacteriaceae bacterium]